MRTIVALMLAAVSLNAYGADAPRPISLTEVEQVMDQNDRSVQACSRSVGTKTVRAVLMNLLIDSRGKVVLAEGAPGTFAKEAACLTKVVRRMKFPATGEQTRLAYPFLLTAHR